MIIKRAYALRLVKEGRARIGSLVFDNERFFVSIDRIDIQRVDHYPAVYAEIKKRHNFDFKKEGVR